MKTRSRVTTQGPISVPAKIRKKLGAGPGALREWSEYGEDVVVRRVGRSSFAEIHAAAFPNGTSARKSLAKLKGGIRARVRKRHARD
jgi:bifunctional DNA-binding transcriptional regulator/antitoxin component of YhaV-PrlF toxin-antitoxin module